MPDGGQLTIEMANVCIDGRGARDMRSGQYIETCVTDTGTGMPPDVVARVPRWWSEGAVGGFWAALGSVTGHCATREIGRRTDKRFSPARRHRLVAVR
jgi:hypothetical protein